MRRFSRNSATADEIQNVNPALLKRICFQSEFHTEITLFKCVTTNIGRQIKEIHICINSPAWLALIEILSTNGLPNLGKLVLSTYSDLPAPAFGLVALGNLEVLEIRGNNLENANNDLQTMIGSAASLKTLKIHGPFFPDLQNCAKTLKTLEWFALSDEQYR